MWRVLRNRNFALLWAGQLVSGAGDWLRNMAFLYWVLDVTRGQPHQPMAVAAITVATTLPALLFGVVGGALADRWDRRRILIAGDAVRGALSATQLLAVHTGSLPLAYAIAFTAGAVQQVYDPARAALIPYVVPHADLLAASALRNATANGLMMVGAAAGTGVYVWLGPTLAFSLDAASFLVSALLAAAIRVQAAPAAAPRQGESLWTQVRAGLAYARQSAFLRNLLAIGLMIAVANGTIQAVEVFLVTRDLGRPETSVAWLQTAQGVMAAAGYVILGLMAHRVRNLVGLVIGGLGLAGLGLAALAGAPGLMAAVAGAAIAGAGGVMLNAGLGPLIQTHVARDYLGRVVGAFQSLMTFAMLASAGMSGYLAAFTSARWIMGVGAGMVLISAVVGGNGLRRALAGSPQPGAAA